MNLNYKIISKRGIKNLRLSIKNNGEIVISKPFFVPEFAAKIFVNQHEVWIKDKLSKIRQSKKSSENKLFYKGGEYGIEFEKGKLKINFSNNKILISAYSLAAGLRQLGQIWKKEARVEILKSVKKNSQIMNLKYNKVVIRDQSTRWGSCSSAGNLNFSWRLIMSPAEVLDYVVIHELAHRQFLDHSENFWKLVEKYDHNYRLHRRWLKRNQGQLLF